MGLVASSNFGYLLVPGLRKIFMDEFSAPGDVVPQLFSFEKSSKAVEYDLGIGGMGDMEEFNGTIPYGDFHQQYRVSYTHKEWVKGVKIERKLVDDKKLSSKNLAICEKFLKIIRAYKAKIGDILQWITLQIRLSEMGLVSVG